MVSRFKILYKETIVPNLFKELNYKNYHQVPKLEKININRGLGLNASNSVILNKSINEIATITGQKPIITKSKKSIAGFKTREKMNIGLSVTLRQDKMFNFLDKLINLALPQIRDFRGISSKQFDNKGNFNLGITEQLIFPEINYEDIDQIRGLDINIVTTAKNKKEGKALLKAFNFPFND